MGHLPAVWGGSSVPEGGSVMAIGPRGSAVSSDVGASVEDEGCTASEVFASVSISGLELLLGLSGSTGLGGIRSVAGTSVSFSHCRP